MVHESALIWGSVVAALAASAIGLVVLFFSEASIPRLIRSIATAHEAAGSLPDALQWLDPIEYDGFHLVLQRNANLLGVAEILSCEHTATSDDELAAISTRLDGAQQNLPPGFALSHHVIRRRPAPLVLKTPAGAPRVIHYLRRRQQAFWAARRHLGFDNRHYLVLEGTGPLKDGQKVVGGLDSPAFNAALRTFAHTWRATLDSLAGFATVRALDRDHTLQLFDFFLNPMQPERRERLTYNPYYTIPEQVCGASLDDSATDLRRADNGAAGPSTYFRVLSLAVLPADSWPTMFSQLARVGSAQQGQETSEFWITQHFEIRDAEKFIGTLNLKMNVARALSQVRALASIGQKSIDLVNDAAKVINAIQRDKQGIGYFSMFCVVYDRDLTRLERTCNLLAQEARTVQAQLMVETRFSRMGSFLASLPGHAGVNCRRLFNFRRATVLHGNAADFALIHRDHDGDPDGPVLFDTPEGNPFRWHPWSQFTTAWNGVVMGTTGAGKSFFMNHVVSNIQALEPKPVIYILDVGNSYDPQVQLSEGAVKLTVDFGKTPDLAINPFQFPAAPSQAQISDLSRLMEHLITGGQTALTQSQRVDVVRALNALFQCYTPDAPPVLLDFHEELRKVNEELAKPLFMWLPNGPYEAFFNHPRDTFAQADLVYFELSHFDENPDVASALVYLIFSKIAQRLADPAYDGRPKFILLDECWKFLMNDNMADKIKELYRTIRKHGGATHIITQHPNDLIDSPHRDAILGNTNFVFFLEQKNLTEKTKEAFHLNETQFQILKHLHMHKGQYSDCYLHSEPYKRVLRVRIDPYSAIAYTTDAKQKYLRAQLVEYYSRTMSRDAALQQAINDMAEGRNPLAEGGAHVA